MTLLAQAADKAKVAGQYVGCDERSRDYQADDQLRLLHVYLLRGARRALQDHEKRVQHAGDPSVVPVGTLINTSRQPLPSPSSSN